MDRSLAYYGDLLGLTVVRDKVRSGPSYDGLLGFDNVKLRVVILGDSNKTHLVELVQYLDPTGRANVPALNEVGAANLCLIVDDAKQTHQAMIDGGYRCLSTPVEFTQEGQLVGWIFTAYDPDDIPLTILQRNDSN
jgi:catechol 2,3-dioxygenase-like lactoylglutathione lyase family enzyme